MESRFTTDLCFQDNDGLPYTLLTALRYESALLGHVVVVPAGFKTDLASIPRIAWNVLPKSGRYDRAAVVHDFLYATAAGGITRGQADGVLSEAMGVLGVGAWTRRIIYTAVRVGGWKPWGAYRRGDAPASL